MKQYENILNCKDIHQSCAKLKTYHFSGEGDMIINLRANETNIDFDFNPDKLNYTVVVPDAAEQIIITASTNDGGSIRINEQIAQQSGNEFFLPTRGTLSVLIVVTAQNVMSGSTTYRIDFTKSKSTYITGISIRGLDQKVDFVPLKSNYYYSHTVASIFELPTIYIDTTTESSDAMPSIYINDVETDSASLNEGINNIVIVDNSVSNGTRYSITIEVFIDSDFVDTINLNSTDYAISNIDKVYKYCTVEIDLSNPNPAECCTYTDDAVIFDRESKRWDTFFGHYPVLFKDGKEIVRIDSNDFTKDIFGNTISSTDGDVMIKFPRRGVSINHKDSNTLTVSMTDNPSDFRYTYYAHNVGNVERDAFYLGAYKLSLPNNDGDKINTAKGRSISSEYIEKGLGATGGDRAIPDEIFRYYCENNNSFVNCENYVRSTDPLLFNTVVRYNGNYWRVVNENGTVDTPSEKSNDWELISFYTMEGFFQRTFLQIMYILKYANLNSQATIGAGFVSTGAHNYGRANAKNKTGYSDRYGMDSELVRDSIVGFKIPSMLQPAPNYNVNDYHVKLFGIEDMWGNSWECVNNLRLDKAHKDRLDISLNCGAEYISVAPINNYTNDIIYIKRPLGASSKGFITAESSGANSNQYFCDLGRIENPANISTTSGILRIRPLFNCGANDKNYAGIFACGIYSQVTNFAKSNFTWFSQTPRFEPHIFASSRASTEAMEEKPANWDTLNYYFICNASSSNTARLMYI